MPPWVLGLLAFALSAVEEIVVTRSRQAVGRRDALAAGGWSALFDFLIFVDVYLVVTTGWWMVVPICAGSALGAWHGVRSGQ
jgi:hypothetical protein